MKTHSIRIGLGAGKGIGYKNLVPMDKYVHQLAGKGVKSYAPVMLNAKKLRQPIGDYEHYTMYRLERWKENDDDEEPGQTLWQIQYYLVADKALDKFDEEVKTSEYEGQDYDNIVRFVKLGRVSGQELKTFAKMYKQRGSGHKLDAKGTEKIKVVYSKPLGKFGDPELQFVTRVYDTRERDYLGSIATDIGSDLDAKIWDKLGKKYNKFKSMEGYNKLVDSLYKGAKYSLTFKASELFSKEELPKLIIPKDAEDKLIIKAYDLEMI